MNLGRVSFVGNGNAAWQLCHQLYSQKLLIHSIHSRDVSAGKALATEVDTAHFNLDVPIETDTLFLCVPEDAVSQVLKTCTIQAKRVLHCSGSLPMSALDEFSECGVFYPIQTMTKQRLLEPAQITVCIEASSKALESALIFLADSLGFTYRVMDSEKRKLAHVSAVMVNNFSNHLWHKAAQFAEEHQIDFDLFLPLIMETLQKFLRIGGEDAQTGPARRGDDKTIQEHLDLLKESPDASHLYSLFTESIKNEFK